MSAAPAGSSLVTNASVAPFAVVSKAPVVVGKSLAMYSPVVPVT